MALIITGAWSAMPVSAAAERSHVSSVGRLVRTMEAAPSMERSSVTIIALERVYRLNICLARYEATVERIVVVARGACDLSGSEFGRHLGRGDNAEH